MRARVCLYTGPCVSVCLATAVCVLFKHAPGQSHTGPFSELCENGGPPLCKCLSVLLCGVWPHCARSLFLIDTGPLSPPVSQAQALQAGPLVPETGSPERRPVCVLPPSLLLLLSAAVFQSKLWLAHQRAAGNGVVTAAAAVVIII